LINIIFIDINYINQEQISETYSFSHTNEIYSEWIINSDLNNNALDYFHKSVIALTMDEYKELDALAHSLKHLKEKIDFNNFIIFSPEYEVLRNFYNEGQIQPLGVKGEGLYKLLKVVNNYKDKSYIKTIIESLQLFNWFDDITIPEELGFGEKKLIIKDKYLYTEIDQRSTNEGFLFILFYVTLIVAKETPKAFAIDNIDSFLNPKLCTELMRLIVKLSKKYSKQVFLTTHNPAILDGIDLNDEEQKLFVVSRKKLTGYTRTRQITVENKPKSSTNEPLKLSEAFLRGYLGGLPKGF
jgi:AAA15 family ATPase/GTPase